MADIIDLSTEIEEYSATSNKNAPPEPPGYICHSLL